MSDLPTQGVYQQMHAHSVSGEHLEVLGKQASARWGSGACSTLTDAVVETVKHANLSPEQVKRVVEFANTDAYLREFKKEGGHKVVDFGRGGPADPASILQDLNDGGGGSVFDRGTLDYGAPPRERKHASAYVEAFVDRELAQTKTAAVAGENPFDEVFALRDKIAGACDFHTSEISSLEIQYADCSDRAYRSVKQAALEGHALGEVVQAWAEVAPSAEHVKVAFQLFTPRLVREGVFPSVVSVSDSLQKTAGVQVVNREHPLVVEFDAYCQTLSKLAEHRSARAGLKPHLDSLNGHLKNAAAKGLIPDAWRAAKSVGVWAGEHAGKASERLWEGSGNTVNKIVTHAPHIALALGANQARLAAEQSPTVQQALSMVPGTDAYNYQQIMRQQGY